MQINAIELQKQQINVIPSAKAFAAVLKTLIAQAQDRIVISALYLENDQAGQALMKQLVAAKHNKPALSISVIVDDHRARRGRIGDKAAAGNLASYQALCREHQVDIAFYGVRVKPREVMGVMHLKGMVFDSSVLYSGASINNMYLHQNEHYRLDRYYQIENRCLADSLSDLLLEQVVAKGVVTNLLNEEVPEKSTLKRLSAQTLQVVQQAQYQLSQSSTADLSVLPVMGCGKKNNALNALTLSLIKASETSIILITPYFNLPKQVVREVRRAMARGVTVTMIVGDKAANDFFIADNDSFSTIGIIPYLYEKLLRRFIKKYARYIEQEQLHIHLWRDGSHSFHAKGLMVDDIYNLLTGSNFNPRAWSLDLENAILIQDHRKVMKPDIKLEIERIMKHTRKITHLDMLDAEKQYPEKARKLMKKLTLARIDRLLKRFL